MNGLSEKMMGRNMAIKELEEDLNKEVKELLTGVLENAFKDSSKIIVIDSIDIKLKEKDK